MLSLQAAVISVALFTALFSAFLHAGNEVGKTKKSLLQSGNKKFFEKNMAEIITSVLREKGPCLQRKEASAAKLIYLVQELAKQGIEMKAGYATGTSRLEAKQISEVLVCTENGLQIARHSAFGSPGIFFTRVSDEYAYTTVIR